ncbi:MAG: glycosyltransferase family 2 protein [Candidatus Kuenenia stuttgartiensis]|uniref:glycosyltransferase family 2 protein n=1 Tax=Candidatus Kuenenia sp. TaxID=2499824 RepID=UPI001E18604C|nr:glycosyltransferase family 2 protein [Planctomycetia bacterium]MBZ0190502.1 glycosyltransferase family 2 protein [Candidatus Kuenenia stuttgartiensis]MCL4728440.1 glycosyltransferase family 2 protein [Candidatus Kuenenia stuttgartiensis]GJQ51047.1 MAG: hypothetical protein HKUEN01_34330 [Candidatus Kuenenia stuttgartiensis]
MNLIPEPLVSVLTPVYNCEKYLAACIESVLGQTYKNWEYVIVNNCSTDKTLEIIENYAKKDKRIRIYNTIQLLNVIQNHNYGFSLISPGSKYCKVVQADDWLFTDCIMKMVEVAEAHPTVGIVGSYRLEESWVTCDGLPYPSTVVSGMELCRSRLLGGPYVFGSPTTLLIRSDLIRSRKLFYNENNLHADYEVCYEVLKDFDFGYVHQVLTFTRRHNETETTFARRLNTYILGELIILKKYGHVFLSKQEYDTSLKNRLRGYHEFLGKTIFLPNRKRKEIWDYHKKALKELGLSISYIKLFKITCRILLKRFLTIFRIKKQDFPLKDIQPKTQGRF